MILEHSLPDGSSHIDWLIALVTPPAPDARCVATWRLDCRPDRLEPGEFALAERLTDHRALYLHHQGPLPQPPAPELDHPPVDRGAVRRLAVGSAMVIDGPPDSLHLRVAWRDGDARGPIVVMALAVHDGPAGATVTRVDGSGSEFPRRPS